jgi:predicted enzyme related to lactoylglutathione lyase
MPLRDNAPLGAPCWVDLMTSDQAGATAFYGALFGWEAQEPNPDFGGYLNFTKDGVLVAGCMGQMPGSPMPDLWSTYLASADVGRTLDTARADGGQVIVDAMAVADLGTMAVVLGPDSAAIGVWQPGTHRGFGVHHDPGSPRWFELHTRDYAAAVAFYRDVFGWETQVVSDTDDFRMTALTVDDTWLAGIMDATGHLPEGAPSHWAIYFAVEDLDHALAIVTANGGAVTSPPQDTPYGILASATDPTGAAFRLVQ